MTVIDGREVHDALMYAKELGVFDTSDPGISLFRASMAAGAPMTFIAGGKYLDCGCCEADWLHMAHQAWPEAEFVGFDWRAPNTVDGDGKVTRMQGNGLDPDLFPAASFDGIVSLSAIEHFGLGHYSSDPLDPDGDSRIVANCWRWLKPGGWLYFDVPYDPRGYRVQGTEYRVYDELSIYERLQHTRLMLPVLPVELFRGYVRTGAESVLIDKPIEGNGNLPYYAAMCWIKA